MKRSLLFLFILSCLLVPSLLNANDISITGNIATENLIDSIALSPNTGMAYGIDKQTNSLDIIDLNSHTITKTVPLAKRPAGVAVKPTNNLAYVTLRANSLLFDNGSLCTIDSDGKILNTITINGDPHGIAVNPENNTIVIALESEKKLLVLSSETMETLQEISLPYKPRLVAIDTDSNMTVVTAGVGIFSWWQHIVMIVDTDTGAVLNTITLKRETKGIAVDTGKDTGVTTGLKEINLFDITGGGILSNIKDGDEYLNGIKLKGLTDSPEDDVNIIDNDINTDITSFLNEFDSEIDEDIVSDLENAKSSLADFQNDTTFGLDINPSTHIAVIPGEESLLLLDLNTNTLNEYPIKDIKSLRSVAVDKYRNISLVSYLKTTADNQIEKGVLELQLPNPVPQITELTPSDATIGDSDIKLKVNGEGFITSSSVQFNKFDINTAFSDNNTLDAVIPSTNLTSAGTFPVTVTNPLPAGGVSDSYSFTVQNPVPLISTIDPARALAGTLGLAVNISGKGFIKETKIYVNGIQRSYTPISSTQLKLSLVPADLQSNGAIEITASNPEPGGGKSAVATLTVLNSASNTGDKIPDTTAGAGASSALDNIIKAGIIVVLGAYVPPEADLGFDYDEQQGGGGLVGETIRVLNGNVLEYRNDLQFSSPNKAGLSFTAFYNSQSGVTGALGYGWTHTYEASLDPAYQFNSIDYIKITDATGRGIFFEETTPGVYQAAFNEHSSLTYVSGEYIWQRTDGSLYTFNSAGKLIRITDEKSNSLEISYNANDQVSTVTDTSSARILTFNYNANNLLENITGPVTSAVTDGIWVQYGYDTNANLISVTYADGSGFNYAYTDPYDIHNLTEKKNKANHLINTWSYDDLDIAIANFSVNGTGVSVDYYGGYQAEVTDAYGVLRTYTIGEEGGRKRIIAMSGIAEAPYSANNIVSWGYDANMNLVQTQDAGGVINLYQNYDAKGNPATVMLVSGTTEQRTIYYTYHPGMNVPLTRTEVSVLGSGNKVTIWDYDDDYNNTPNENPTANLCQIIEQGFTADNMGTTVAYEYTTKITYNAKGQVLSIDGPIAGTADTSTFVYNLSSGDLESITRPLVGSSLFQNYDNAGQVGQTTDVNGHVTTYTYDSRGRVKDVYHSADSSTAGTNFNTAGFIESRTDEDGVNTGYTYDTTYGRLSRVTDHEGNYIENLYDTQGNLTDKSYYDPAATRTNWKRFSYQHPVIPGKLYKEIKFDDSFMEYAYDARGNVSAVTDFNGKTTSYTYDALNRLKTVTQPGNLITAYTYDGHGSLASVSDAKSQVTTYQYDDMGRLVQTVSPDTGTVKYSYDEAGNLKQKEDAKAIVVQYDYDDLNRLSAVHFPDSLQDITYSYDQGVNAIGFMSGITDQSGITSFGYDNRGRLAGKTATVNGQVYPVSRTYTPGGRVSSLIYPTGRTVDYHRTSCACSVDSVTTNFGANTTTIMSGLSYRPFGGATAMDNGAGGIVGSVYNLGGKLTVSNPGAEHEMTYGYDKNGNLTSVDAPSTPWYNRVNETPTTYTYYPGTNRLYQTITATETKNYFYDANGNITDIGNRVLTYNQNNRLIRVEEDSVTLGEYTYNGLGQRIIKQAGGVATVFHYDFDGNIIAESDASGVFSKEYLYRGSNRLVLVDVGSGTLYYYGNDQLGTPQILTDSTNTVVWEAVYAPYGEADVNPNSTVVNNFRLPGQYYDEETGLHYNYHRYYDPGTGRYLTADPIGLNGGINLFVYANNSPLCFSDPLGLKVLCIPAMSLKDKWVYRPPFAKEWKPNGEVVIKAGISGVCHWKMIEKGRAYREVTPVKLCIDTCKKILFYRIEFSKTKTEFKKYERDAGKAARGWMRWYPAEVSFVYICDPRDIIE